jgi:hypothetical protein
MDSLPPELYEVEPLQLKFIVSALAVNALIEIKNTLKNIRKIISRTQFFEGNGLMKHSDQVYAFSASSAKFF